MNRFRELSVGKILYNKYVIEKVLGAGGFGITYYARHTALNRHYAIKEFFINGFCVRSTQSKDIHLQGLTKEEYNRFREKFVEEARTLAKLDHENIVRVIDMFEENNTSYIVMPFIEGVTLQQLVKQNGKLDYEIAVNYMAQLAEAIGYIHEQNILHRDISPDNVIITPQNKIMLIDFGSAREFIHDKTQSHTAILKKGYAPLEQYSVTSRKGTYSDIYSLGAVFYFILTGQKPMEATERTMENNMPDPKSFDASIPNDASRTILKAMALKPEYRHQNIKEFMDDLLGKKPSKPVKKAVKKNRKKSLFLLFIAILLAAIAVVALLQQNGPEKIESDFQKYTELANQAKENYDKGENYYVTAAENYTKAAEYEIRYANSEYNGRFNLKMKQKVIELEKKIDSLVTGYKKKADLFENYRDESLRTEQQIINYEKIMILKPDDKNIKEKLEKLKKLNK
jgi:serine/threonine protein kinase